MKTSAAVTAIIMALVIGYAAGYGTFLVRFPTPEAVRQLASAARLELLRAQRRGVVVMALFRKAAG